jgi:hypothetical protein
MRHYGGGLLLSPALKLNWRHPAVVPPDAPIPPGQFYVGPTVAGRSSAGAGIRVVSISIKSMEDICAELFASSDVLPPRGGQCARCGLSGGGSEKTGV